MSCDVMRDREQIKSPMTALRLTLELNCDLDAFVWA